MFEGNEYAAIDTAFPFISAFINSVTEFGDNTALNTVHTLCKIFFDELLYINFLGTKIVVAESVLNGNTRQLKTVTKIFIKI